MSGLIRNQKMMFTENFICIATDALKSHEGVYIVYKNQRCIIVSKGHGKVCHLLCISRGIIGREGIGAEQQI